MAPNKWILAFILLPIFSYGDSISLSGNPGGLTISSAVAGQQPTSASNSSTTYSVATTTVVRRITGKINSAMPAGVTLSVRLTAPSGATSAGSVAMTTTTKNLVTSIPKNTNASGLSITYTLSATAAAAKVTNATKTLTLTLQ